MTNQDVTLRPAGEEDMERVFQWRCQPEIYEWMRQQDGPLEWDGHVSWWQSRPDERSDWIIEYGDLPVGVVSIAPDGDIGIYLGDRSVWGKGIATRALKLAIENTNKHITAEIHEDNDRSQHLFEGVGFYSTGRDGPWVQYEYR